MWQISLGSSEHSRFATQQNLSEISRKSLSNSTAFHMILFFFRYFPNNQMRHEMVLQKEGEMEFSLLTHSDDMKRVSTRTQRFVDIQQQNQLLGMLSPTCHSQMHSTSLIVMYWRFRFSSIDIFMVRLMELPLHWQSHCPTNMECMN